MTASSLGEVNEDRVALDVVGEPAASGLEGLHEGLFNSHYALPTRWRTALRPVKPPHRRTATSTKAGEISMARHFRRSFSAAINCEPEPEPENGSSTTAPGFVCCSMGISKSRTGF